MNRSAACLIFLVFSSAAWGQTPFSVDLRNWEAKAAAPGSQPAPGYKRIQFSRSTWDTSRDYALFVLPPDRFKPAAFRDGTREKDPPVASVMAVQAILEYLGYGKWLEWYNPQTGAQGAPVDGAYGLATRKALEYFLGDVGWRQSPDRVDRTLYSLLYQLFILGQTGAENLEKPLPGKAVAPLPDAPVPEIRDVPPDLPQVSPQPAPPVEAPAASPEDIHAGHTMLTEAEAEPMEEAPGDLPWNRLLEGWLSLGTADQARYETAAREELAKDGANAPIALQILLQHGWKQNKKTLVKGTDGIWLPRRFWKE